MCVLMVVEAAEKNTYKSAVTTPKSNTALVRFSCCNWSNNLKIFEKMCVKVHGAVTFLFFCWKKYMLKSVHMLQHYLKLVLEEVCSWGTHTQHTYVTWLQIWTYVCVYAAHVLLRNFNLVEKSGMWDRLLFLRKVLLLLECLIAVCSIWRIDWFAVHKRSRHILGV